MREVLLENAELPPVPEMKQAIAERKAWYVRHSIEEEHVRYRGGLKRTLKDMVKRAAGGAGMGKPGRMRHKPGALRG